jgi:uncharacterized FlaG/YvyC family protein
MDISGVSSTGAVSVTVRPSPRPNATDGTGRLTAPQQLGPNGTSAPSVAPVDDGTDKKDKKKDPSAEALKEGVKSMNGAMESVGTSVRFAVHDKTKVVMVQAVSPDGKVISEMPTHEFLDMVAKVRASISTYLGDKGLSGNLIDKKA